jgi:hypothetical protein
MEVAAVSNRLMRQHGCFDRFKKVLMASVAKIMTRKKVVNTKLPKINEWRGGLKTNATKQVAIPLSSEAMPMAIHTRVAHCRLVFLPV